MRMSDGDIRVSLPSMIPKSAAELKASILDRAVHGLLVPQREEERFEKFEGLSVWGFELGQRTADNGQR